MRFRTAFAFTLSAVLVGCADPGDSSDEGTAPPDDEAASAAPAGGIATRPAEGQEIYAGQIGADEGGLRSVAPAGITLREGIAPEDRAVLDAEKRAIPEAPARPMPPTADEHALEVAQRSAPDKELRVVLLPDDPPFEFGWLQGADDARRAQIIAARAASVAEVQDRVVEALERAGARDIARLPLLNHVHATVAAREVPRLAAMQGVQHLYLDDSLGSPLGYGGLEAREGARTDVLIAAGYHGNTDGRANASQPTRIGIIEWDCSEPAGNWINRDHVGWEDTAGGTSRVKRVMNCRGGSCVDDPSAGGNNHGTWVAWAAAGSIEQAQDAAYPGAVTVDQQRRSGQSRESDVYYYNICGCSAVSTALQQAIADGVDVTNMSFRMADCEGGAFNCGGINEALKATTDAGIVNVAASGNFGSYSQSACNFCYPSWRPDVIGVNGLDTANINTDYDSTILADRASERASTRGPVPIRTFTGHQTTMSGVGLVAPAIYQFSFAGGTNVYNNGSHIYGTSFAAPTVAGAVANMRHALNDLGWPGNDARMLMTMMFSLGDTWDGANPGADKRTHTSSLSGYGRLRVHYPAHADMAGPWGWGIRSAVIHHNQTLSWPIWDAGPEWSSATQWKWALTWFEDDLSNVADIDISVWDTCPAGGGPAVQVAAQADYDLRNRIHLRAPEIAGRCLEMRVHGYNVPAAGRVVYSSDYIHSGDPDQH